MRLSTTSALLELSVSVRENSSDGFVRGTNSKPASQGAPPEINSVATLVDAAYDWNGNDLQGRGLYLDMPPWAYHVFDLQKPTGALRQRT